MISLPLRQGSPEWLEGRRALVTATDIPVILGIDPWRCEADLADEKLGRTEPRPATIPMKVGSALEPVIVEEYEAFTGRRLRRSHAMVRHPAMEWAAASLDATVIGERRIVELKHTMGSRFADGLPQDVEAQVAWQLGVTGYPVADVAVLTGREFPAPIEVQADPALFADLVTAAEDFRRRLESGGPFRRDHARIKRDHPSHIEGSEMAADAELVEAVAALIERRATRKALEAEEEALEAAIKDRMGDTATLVGPGWRITWRQTKAREETDWKSLAAGFIAQLPETEREALVGLFTTVRPGFRPFRVAQEA